MYSLELVIKDYWIVIQGFQSFVFFNSAKIREYKKKIWIQYWKRIMIESFYLYV